ncbi:hypothetical protein V6C53_04185 [Desulfocurvibacter africanus]|uniref:Uncharacterized protein n=1 Tax=Desulfocurvibacter africanus subsp. africanus str. Walvis Bay TaxID=690850 RepID=F3YXU3_DESAF|nr:hypothetical protein [Desulfocurvibacter africanus]EGJ50645.1 hypothetical protein Desaf_2321 [Desulfocurvibacter africanus subsp. africanus str. Walvis Bay]
MLTTYHYAKIRSTGELYAVEFHGDKILKVCGPVDMRNFQASFPGAGLKNCPTQSIDWLQDQEYDWVAPGELNPSQDQQTPNTQMHMPEGCPGKGRIP